MWCDFHGDQSCHAKGECHRALHNSCGHISVRFCEVSTAGWDKNLENDTKMLMSLSGRWLCMGHEGFVHSKGNEMDFIEQVLTWPWQPSSVVSYLPKWSHHRAMSTWHCSDWWQRCLSGTCSSLCSFPCSRQEQFKPRVASIISLKPKLPWKNAFLLFPVVAFTVQPYPVL